MWLWQQNTQCNKNFLLTERQQFFGQLCFFVFIVHLIVLMIAIFFSMSHGEKKERFEISVQKRAAVYVLTPYKRQAQLSKNRKSKSSAASLKNSKVISYDQYQTLQKLKQGKKTVPKRELKVTKKESKSRKSMHNKKEKKEAKSAVNAGEKSLHSGQQCSDTKAQISIVSIEAIDLSQKKNDKPISVKKNTLEEKKQELKEKIDLIKKDQIQEKKPEVVIAQEHEVVELNTLESQEQILQSENDAIDLDEVVFVESEQLDNLTVQSKIQQMVQQHFKSPVGMNKNVTCELVVLVGAYGKSEKVSVVKSSGVPVYDVSARAMLLSIEFPKEVWNKTITIALGQ
ncbi:TonB C-terminal domain-containing protein [Candidatus Dependentiae bacterium]|nr:TonB C-terminal domain-containing protein [Candidatus Dependentiae bacterium]